MGAVNSNPIVVAYSEFNDDPQFRDDWICSDADSAAEEIDGATVWIYPAGAVVEGDLDLLDLWEKDVLGVVALGDLTVTKSILDGEYDTPTTSLSVRGNLVAKNLWSGSAEIRVNGNATVTGLTVGVYNHGFIEVTGDLTSTYLAYDEPGHIIVGGNFIGEDLGNDLSLVTQQSDEDDFDEVVSRYFESQN